MKEQIGQAEHENLLMARIGAFEAGAIARCGRIRALSGPSGLNSSKIPDSGHAEGGTVAKFTLRLGPRASARARTTRLLTSGP
jgi:hypothetical protein